MKNKVVRAVLAVVMACSLFASCQPVVAFADNAEQMISAEEKETTKPLKIVGVIPARYASSRFPGKPLADICGKPMVWWVYQQAKKVPELSEVYVATDDERIETVCKQYNMDVIMTSKDHPTGTDRVAEVAEKIEADLYVNIQGDEPLLEPENISKVIEPFYNDNGLSVTTLMTPIRTCEDVIDNNVVKILVNDHNDVIYASRLPIPYPRGNAENAYYEHVGCYAFKPDVLKFFHSSTRSKVEKIEEIECLRFIENGYKIKSISVPCKNISVDTPKDLERIKNTIVAKTNETKKLKILDCTLRDGGYINNWEFGKENISGIINKLVDSNVDIIECGYYNLSENTNINKSLFKDLSKSDEFKNIICSLMTDPLKHSISINNVPNYSVHDTDIIRVCFYKKDADKVLNFCSDLKNKGYKVFIQPMVTASYSEDELVSLITKANEMSADAFYLVDSHGTMNKDELLKLFNIADKNLAPNIAIGFHSHNNLQLAFSNALALLDVDTEREIIIDSSVFGMGRGAGNLCTELLMQEINNRYGEKYNLEPIFKIYDEHLKDIYERTPWGYSMPLFISAKHKCHPNYTIHLSTLGLNSAEIDKILSNISAEKKSVFDQNYMQKLYDEYLSSRRQYDCVAFDVDGTLIDSAEGVLNAIRYVEKELKLTPLDENQLKSCIGPPLKHTYEVAHQLSGKTLEKAVSLHKKYMSEKGYKEAKLYDGVEDMLRSLKTRGKKLAIATLKQESIAKQTLTYLGISHYFDLILGQNQTESLRKADLLTQIKKDFFAQRLVLVGDSKFDEEAANATNTDFIAVTYGYGFAPDINTDVVKAIKLCANVSDVKSYFT